jgi:GMP synthase-like glutamine amidotransferase
MHVHYLQHVPFEGLGSIEPWLDAAGHRISCTRLYTTRELPPADSMDALIVMGGPMSVNDEDAYPWLVSEKRLVREAVRSGKPVLGICLGAQLIASALGERVYQNPIKEIGWFSIHGISSGDGSSFCFPPEMRVFHWHGETFDMPQGATRIARSAECENQAFQLGDSVIGLQFHLETTPESARAMVANCREELRPSRCIQSETEILSAGSGQYDSANKVMADILSYLFRRKV